MFSMWLGVLILGFQGIFDVSGIQEDFELIFGLIFNP